MGIISSFKKRLPIVGAGSGSSPSSPQPTEPRAQVPPAAATPDPKGGKDAATFIGDFVKSNPITLFMKGNPMQPMCGFSANAAAILGSYGHEVAHVDVLSDPEIRQGIKDYSNWPTIPQIYVGGEFLGGSDILAQMHEAGELKEAIDAAIDGDGK